jgi:hypothetical protein
MNTTTVPTGLTATSAESDLETAAATELNAADTTASSRLDNLSLVHQARISQLTRTVVALTAQYGSTSTQVAKAQAAVTAESAIVTRLAVIRQQNTATAPTVAATGWAVWGHVYDSSSNPLSGYCVFLVDAQKNYLREYGFEFTDKTGSFTIQYAGTTPPAGANETAPTVPTVYLAITNAKAQLVYYSPKPLAITIGAALYADTTLAAGAPAIGDLPNEIRAVALPPVEK